MCKNYKNCKWNQPASISLSLQHNDGNAFIPSFVDKIIQTGTAFFGCASAPLSPQKKR